MAYFQSPTKLIIVLIVVWITQFSFTLSQTSTTKCIYGFEVQSPAYQSACYDEKVAKWICPTDNCQRDGHRWVQMKNCLLGSLSGTSTQQCSTYKSSSNGRYECTNLGNQNLKYLCPYTIHDVPYITCTDCTKPKPMTGQPAGPRT